jgi:transposase
MEATGVYWKPVYNILESGFDLMLVNAKHIKAVPGRKTDVRDAEWIAQLLQHGLLQPSFVPRSQVRELRELTRHRTKLVQQRASVINRIQKVLEDANIKLASVATDIMGKSGRAMLDAMVAGNTDHEALAELSRKSLRNKIPELREALRGRVTEHHRFMLRELLAQADYLNAAVERVSERIAEKMHPFDDKLDKGSSIPGVGKNTLEKVLSEIGSEMSQFKSDKHLLSWAKVCPSNNESAGKHKSEKTGKGNNWLRGALLEAAWSAVRVKGTYLSAFYSRIARRRGKNRAIMAVAAKLLTIIYHMWRDGTTYKELGADFFDKLNEDSLKKRLIRRLESLDLDVHVTPKLATAVS